MKYFISYINNPCASRVFHIFLNSFTVMDNSFTAHKRQCAFRSKLLQYCNINMFSEIQKQKTRCKKLLPGEQFNFQSGRKHRNLYIEFKYCMSV
jgi:hypothetical protein